jgi:hypothetical protein
MAQDAADRTMALFLTPFLIQLEPALCLPTTLHSALRPLCPSPYGSRHPSCSCEAAADACCREAPPVGGGAVQHAGLAVACHRRLLLLLLLLQAAVCATGRAAVVQKCERVHTV